MLKIRIKIECETQKENLPLEYRRKFISYLKSAFIDYDQDLFAELYGGHANKPFCFSIYFLPEVVIAKAGIKLYSKRFLITFSTPDVMMGVHLVNVLMNRVNRWFTLGDSENQLKILNLNKMPEYPISGNTVAFRILSPIVVRDHDKLKKRDWYYTFEDEEFEIIWKRNLKSELQNTFKRNVDSDIDALQIKPIKLKKTVILSYGINIPVTIGTFVIEGEKYLLEYFYKAGMGSKRNLGFGCLDVI